MKWPKVAGFLLETHKFTGCSQCSIKARRERKIECYHDGKCGGVIVGGSSWAWGLIGKGKGRRVQEREREICES